MKASKYNFFLQLDEEIVLIFNSKSCALAEVNKDYTNVLEKLQSGQKNFSEVEKKIIEELEEVGFVVPKSIDEFENLKNQHYRAKYNQNHMSITLAPTMDCNLACKYCFENRKPGLMSEKVQNSVLKYLASKLNDSSTLDINWYGGEPLLALDMIEKLSERIGEITKDKKCDYKQTMVTNGYLLSEEYAVRLKKMKLDAIQITLDGEKEVHDSRRVLKDGKTGSFEKILQGVKNAINVGLNVTIRVNIDKVNYPKMDDFLKCLKENEINKVKVAFGHVLPYTSSCEGYTDNCFSKEEYSNIVLDIQNMMQKAGLKNESVIYPSRKLTYCSACNYNSFSIDSDGDMYKCWCEVGDKKESFSNITEYENLEDEDQNNNLLKWINRTPFDDSDCKECRLLPICMGGCPKMGHKDANGKSCDLWKYNIENMIKCTYNYYTNE